jgi:uncharacterized membrane protein
MVVHFPIAILALALLFDLAGLLTKIHSLERAGWWSQVAGTVALLAAVISGLLAEKGVLVSELAHSTLETHQQFALLATAICCILLLWRIAHRTRLPARPRALFLSLMALTVIVIWAGSYFGGELVYKYGVGVR